MVDTLEKIDELIESQSLTFEQVSRILMDDSIEVGDAELDTPTACPCSATCGSNFSQSGSCPCSSNCGSNYSRG